nr:hypothetical protein [Tanacetum cinerariifolium]
MTLRAGNFKVRFIRTLRFLRLLKEKDDLDAMIPTNFMNRRILEWEEQIKKCKDDEIKLRKWRSKVFKDKNLVGHNFFIYDDELKKDDDSRTDDRTTKNEIMSCDLDDLRIIPDDIRKPRLH